MEERKIDAGTPQVNPGYASFQIAKALTTSEGHEDPATRERARQRVAKWSSVLNGILSGTLDVGSRTPIEGVPAWATFKVVTGGFVTGEMLAGGPLREHERALLATIAPTSGADARRVLNAYYLSDDGLAQLQAFLRSGCYEVTIPEEGALLVVAWMVQNQFIDEARSLLEELGPYFPRLRFYPVPREHARRHGSRVCLQDVGETISNLRNLKPNLRILAQREAIQVWTPLYDQIVDLFLDTVQGELPSLRRDQDGGWTRAQDGRFPVYGGWPCQTFPDGWSERAKRLLEQYERARMTHRLCGKPDRAKGSFAQLRKYLQLCANDPSTLNGRDVGRIRTILARYVNKRGTPNSPSCRGVRGRQAAQAGAPTFQEISAVVLPRLASNPTGTGLDDLRPILQPVTNNEAGQTAVKEGTTIPTSLQRKVERCLNDTVEVLVDRGIITSGDTLARVLPQMTSGIKAAGITEPELRQLYSAIYRAFRQRRSLLLLNLESQVKIEELPWVAAIERFRRDDLPSRELAKQALEEVAVLVIASFPQAILPNKLLHELRALAKEAGLELPLVDEVAADIFMGEFSGKFLQAAKHAAELLQGSLYETYYGIDYEELRKIPVQLPKQRSWFRRSGSSDPFVQLCSSRAGVTYGGWDPAINGMIIEQQQVLTTQNLAVLFEGLQLRDCLGDRLEHLAQRCFEWVCRRQQVKADKWHAQLIMVKNTAYAWRQMVFFLALLPPENVRTFLSWADGHLGDQPEGFQVRFRPAWAGLVAAAEGRSIESEPGARRFLGWSKEKHWLLD